MAVQNAAQDYNQFPALLLHTGTAGTAETIRAIADSDGNLMVNIAAGESINIGTLNLGTIDLLKAGSVVVTIGTTTSQAYYTITDGTTTTDVIYIGKGTPGSNTGSAVWQIAKMDETTSDVLTITYAGGSSTFTNIWTSRGTLSYS